MEKISRVSFVSARGLGDALLTMTLAYRLQQKGTEVEFYSDVLYGMRAYFPDVQVFPFLNHSSSVTEVLEQCDYCIFADGMISPNMEIPEGLQHFILDRKIQSRRVGYVESFAQQLSQVAMDLTGGCWENGLQLPAQYQRKRYARRIVLHPTSSDLDKDWPMPKFVKLGQRLIRAGYEPVFILTDKEKSYQEAATAGGIEYVCLSLEELVPYLYESGAMVANDSGPGHLGAFAGLPVISMFPKFSRSVMWRPVGPNVTVVVPPFRLIGKRGSCHWKLILGVSRVYRTLMAALNTP